ncbi:MAG: hypothetical protein WC455_19900 [Dehalococcoidia bacterium]|jgi:hypothetical protein
MTLKKDDTFKPFAFAGGCIPSVEKEALPPGAFSLVQNMRPTRPGFVARKGQIKKHSTADGTNGVMTVFQFSKGKRTERHFYAQFTDGDVLDATDAPPTVTSGAFGTEVFSGSASSVPGSWAICDDMVFFTNGVDAPQVCAGEAYPVESFIVYKGSGAIPTIPLLGEDYTEQVNDGDATTGAVLDSLGTLATDYDCIFIRTATPCHDFNFTLVTGKENTSASVMACNYYNGSLTAVTAFSDGTITSAKTLTKAGAMSFTEPTDEIPAYMFGEAGFWYQFYLSSGALDSEVEVASVTCDTTWTDVQNVWDSDPQSILECQIYDASDAAYYTYGSSAIDISDATSSDVFYFATLEKVCGFFFDMGDTPNINAAAITDIQLWNGSAFASVGAISDGSNGLQQSGWATFARATTAQPVQFNSAQNYLYWWKMTMSATLSDSVTMAVKYMPYYTISEFGKAICCAQWRNRMCYTFDQFPADVYISGLNRPFNLNGADFAVKRVGDGRSNRVVAMREFRNELICFQEEKGTAGGCITLIQGYGPTTYGMTVISTTFGAMNAKCVEVVDSVRYVDREGNESVKVIAFALSHYGVLMVDGKHPYIISDAIKNYFDPTQAECIRRGYENQMWLKYDAAYNGIMVGLVSGTSATTPNVFWFYDLEEKAWYSDARAQNLMCMCNVEAASGDIPILQYGGGCADGFVYQMNTGTTDVSTAIDSFAVMELDGRGAWLNLQEMILRKNGTCTLTPYTEGSAGTARNIT